jgi:hypothetical protein
MRTGTTSQLGWLITMMYPELFGESKEGFDSTVARFHHLSDWNNAG